MGKDIKNNNSTSYKKRWYLKTWFIALMFALWFFIIPPIIGIILLVLKSKENKILQEEHMSLLEQMEKLKKESLETKKDDLDRINNEITNSQEKLKNINIELDNITKTLNENKDKNNKLSSENSELSSNTQALLKQKEDLIVHIDKLNSELEKTTSSKEKLTNEINSIKEKTETLKNNAMNEAKSIKEKSSQEAKEIKIKSDEILSNATSQANKIVEDANARAKEIAGDAYAALKNTQNLEQTAKAMKNIIEGYGDEYIIPTYGLLDDLADDFGYTEAGQELKKARERTRLMIRNKTAAKCYYVEPNRKETAIRFVLDAFNGKVDTILSTIKRDNYGKLQQKIKDSFQVVNNLGRAFRNATITEEYLNSRLEELKWAVTANELKIKEKEEQHRIKQQIREEERARREYEKAIKQAAKEESLLKKLMEKAKKELSEANEQQKAQYEHQLSELEEKLKVAEENNQRAISMSQQTKTGHVYIISNIGSFGEDVYKIGMTRRLEPNDRIRELGDASVPFSFDVHAMIYSEDAPKLETALHKKFAINQMNKVNPRKEFFKVPLKELKSEIDSLGINAKWTLLAEAKEYKESLAIEKSISENSIDKDSWEKYQLKNKAAGE
ncbi:DUF4041 domain-containing protein [Clostridium tyrobutyricum]|uniref:DUF4041 domain-containing protein n=1 Tax=Clostridium tyrobutyricum TaxID=1519 RepID=UPI001FAAD922|nr:DUF4041 domain-containing protein [Clostridium tyrobutyricum]